MFRPLTHEQTLMLTTLLPCQFLPFPSSAQTQSCPLQDRNLEQAFLIAALNTKCPQCGGSTAVFLLRARLELRRVYPDLILLQAPVLLDQILLHQSRFLQQLWLFANRARPPRSDQPD